MPMNKKAGKGPVRRALRRSTRAVCVQHNYDASIVDDEVIFVNTTPGILEVRRITARPCTAGTDGSAVTLALVKADDGDAVGSGTALHTGTINLKGTVDTNQDLTLSTTKGALNIQPGQAITANLTGTATAARGTISIDMIPA